MAKKPIKSPAKKLPAKKVVKVVVAKAKKTVKPAKPVKVVKAAVKSKVLTRFGRYWEDRALRKEQPG